MRAAIVSLVTIIALMTSVLAQSSGKVLVLPLDGSAPAAQRDALNASLLKMAKDKLPGDVTKGETTFNETAAAVGCDPMLASCAEQVRTTLAVDELVYGSANTADGTTTITVNRVSAGGGTPKTQISVISESDPAENAEAGLAPVFIGSAVDTGSGSDAGSGSGSGSAERPRPGSSFFSTTERKVGVAFLGGGVLALVLGFAYWSSASSKQDQIDEHPTATTPQINDLKQLEDEAASKALWGNIFVALGLAATGVGVYYLWKDHKNRNAASITPAPTADGGMTLILRGQW